MQVTHFDVIIVGGGMVGSALACMLAKKTSLSIAILEAKTQQTTWDETNYHHRVSAIALSSQRIFQSVNIWETLRDQRVSPFNRIQVWDGARQGEITFDSRDIAEPVLGYIIENNLMQSTLEARAREFENVTFISPIHLKSLIEQDDGVELLTDDQRCLKAKLVIAADGANSWVRQQAGIALDKLDYQQHAIVATVETALPHHQTARQVFLETGPLAFLPLREERLSSIVWSLPVEEATTAMSLDDETFQTALARAFEYRLGDVVRVEARHVFPLGRQHAKQYVKPHIALVGDAAHTMHPLAGQGVNLGLLDAASLADVIIEAVKQHKEFGSLSCLRRYERWRKADNANLLMGVDQIKRLFANQQSFVQTIRSMGLNATDRCKWLKNVFTRHAVGDRDGLPSFASGH